LTDTVTLLHAVSANGTGPAINTGRVEDELTIEVTTSGTVAAFSIQLQGSIDGTNWASIGSAVTATTAGTNVSTGALYKQFQAVMSGYSGTGTVSCFLAYDLSAIGTVPAGTTSSRGLLQLDGSAADIATTSTQAAGAGAVGKAADAGHVHPVYMFGASDHGLISWAFDPSVCATGAGTALATAGTVYTVKLHLPVSVPVTSILVYLKAGGNTLTSGQNFAALYQGIGGALLGVTADQTANWGSGTVVKTMAISGGPVTPAAGDLFAAFWFNGTGGPTFAQAAAISVINAGLAAASSRYGTANASVTTTAPPTLGTISASSLALWAAIS
jgi:hypothetical protein